MGKVKTFEFESMELVNAKEEFRLIRVHYDLDSEYANIDRIEDVDSGAEFTFFELPAIDGIYVMKRLKELNAMHDTKTETDYDYENARDLEDERRAK